MNQSNNSKFVPGLPDDDDNTVKIYEGVVECTMSDADTLKSVKVKVKDLATQKVQRKIADYVYAFWKDRYLTLPDDEVLSIANEISNITDVKYNVLDSDDNVLVRAAVTAQVDDNDVMNYIIQFFKERAELKIQNEALRNEIADLKQQQDKTTRAIENQNKSLIKENSDLKRQIEDLKRQRDNIELAYQKYIKASRLYRKSDYKGAIEIYSEAIQLYPKFAGAYSLRGTSYEILGDKAKAQADYSKAKELG